MANSLFARLFGGGTLPADLMAQLQMEGIVLLDEGVWGSVTYRDFRRPGMYANWKRRKLLISIALTKTRLLAVTGANPIINVPLTDERLRAMRFSIEDSEVLCVAFDAGLFQPTWSGTIEYRCRTPKARQFLEMLPH